MIRQVLRFIAVSLALMVVLVTTVQAQETPLSASTLWLTPILDQQATLGLAVEAVLTSASGDPLADMTLSAYVDGELRAFVLTDDNGHALIALGGRIRAGSHTIRVDFAGTSDYQAVSRQTTVSLAEAIPQLDVREAQINPPRLVIHPAAAVPVGRSIVVDIQISNALGRALGNLPLVVYVDGVQVRRARTDEDGLASIGLGNEYSVGTHDVQVDFIGTEAYEPVSATRSVVINPIELTIQTIPPLPNMPFSFNGSLLETDTDGVVRTYVSQPGTYPLVALPIENNQVDGSTRAEFQRWSDSVFTDEREVELTSNEVLQAGYTVEHLISMTFNDLDNQPVQEDRVDTITLRSSAGDHLTFEDGQTRWLQATRINRRREGLEATTIQYSVEEVIVDGSNVVNRYQQRFYINPNDVWEIQLLLYHAVIQARDALFNFPVGTGINVTLPSGETIYYPYNADNRLEIGPMGRGTYQLQVVGAAGMASVTPTALTRNQVVDLKVLTVVDMAVGVVAGLVVGFGLLFYGRPFLLTLPLRIASSQARRLQARRKLS